MRGAFLLTFLLAMPAFAASSLNNCPEEHDSTSANIHGTVGPGRTVCFDFTADEDSPVVRSAGAVVQVCLDPDMATDGTGNATVHVRSCPYSHTTADPNKCHLVTDSGTPLDGTGGDSDTQNVCTDWLPPYRGYYVENAASAAGDEARATFHGMAQ